MASDTFNIHPNDRRPQPNSFTLVKDKDDWKAVPSSCQVLRAGRDAHYWQIQYYPEPLASSEKESIKSETSSFAQTLKEEDDLFYQTFPDARLGLGSPRQWSSLAMSSPHFQGSTGFYIHSQSIGKSFHVDADADADISPVIQRPGFTSELLDAIQSPCVKTEWGDSDQISLASLVPERKDEPIASVHERLAFADSNTNCPARMSIHEGSCQTCMDVDHGALPYTFQSAVEPPMACLSPPPHDDDLSPSNKTLDGLTAVTTPVKEEFSPIQDLNLIPSPTGTWPSLRMRSQSQTDSSTLSPSSTSISSSETTTLTSYGRRLSASPVAGSSLLSPSASAGPSPTILGTSETAGPSMMRLSPLPANRRPVERKKTQTLACQFCRHRKIACGPPRSGTTERTCNQCQRRSLECVFPAESRRGMRKKKSQTTQKPIPDSPKPVTSTNNQSAKSEPTQKLTESALSPLPQEPG